MQKTFHGGHLKRHKPSIVNLLSLILQGFDYIQLARAFGDDFLIGLGVHRRESDTLLEIAGRCDPRLADAAKQALEEKLVLTKITISATDNYGIQMGVNRGTTTLSETFSK